jgi:Icc protein
MSTVLPASHEGPIRLLQLSDFHLLRDPAETMMGINTEQSFKSVVYAASRDHGPADLVLMTGDLAQDASPEVYARLRDYLQAVDVPVCCIPGNHDELELMQSYLLSDSIYLGGEILLGSWQIICLDSTVLDSAGGYLRRDQMAFLESALDSAAGLYTLVCLHHSPLPTHSQWLDTMRLGNGEEFIGLLQNRKRVRAVVFGHVHQAMDIWEGDLRLLACPSTCFQFKPGSSDFALDAAAPGYRWLDLHPDGAVATGVVRLASLPTGLNLASPGY